MQAPRLGSVVSSVPSASSLTSLPRPSSANGHNSSTRLVSEASSILGSNESNGRNARVVLRIRPPNPDDASVPPRFRDTLVHRISSSDVRVDVDPSTLAGQSGISVVGGSKRHPIFSFDHVLGEESSQIDLYDVTGKEVLEDFMRGRNVTFLAYGQTSSGKSYTMGTTGDDSDYSSVGSNPRTGLIPRTVQSILERAEDTRLTSGAGASWECRISFLELYNEEIIDLLSASGSSISIREERDGRIIWSGVREIKIKSLVEVMQLLQDGSARRKTSETGMNATSSRSHAIFSLTIVQRKRTGIISSTSQPLWEDTSTPTRTVKRPSSAIGLPDAGRSPIPSGRSPIPSGSRPGPPPSSFTGMQRPGLPRPKSIHVASTVSESDSEFVVVTSKFNMVDLAGSERLKRTAAQGDRMKEGISINSGLLALGNVISTLCDPVKARGHIPYRDSKLTRMLQDSIGGNALTTMIACVSGLEFNISETLNTIKYASRARNIKNSARINAIEAGWDDVEHLQNVVLKLRRQLAAVEMEGKGSEKGTSGDGFRQNETLIQRLADLQREHTDLHGQYLKKCGEQIRITSELRVAQPGEGDALAKFNETVEPVILEYEKVVSALNSQLDSLRVELTAMNDLHEEKNGDLVEARHRQAQSEGYVIELRNRVTKLSERNTSSEAYVHDLEGKLKLYSDQDDSNSEVVANLQKDILKLKESNRRFDTHTSELETRLSHSEAHSSSLASQIEQHEREAERRETAYRDLESHVELLHTTGGNEALFRRLDQRGKRIPDTMDSERNRSDLDENLGSKRATFADNAGAEKAGLLSAQLASFNASTSTISTSDHTTYEDAEEFIPVGRSPRTAQKELTPPDSPETQRQPEKSQETEVAHLRAALKALLMKSREEEFQRTQADAKIADLTSQLSDAKLVHAETEDVVPMSPAMSSPVRGDDASESESTILTPRWSSSSPSSSPNRSRDLRGGPLPLLVTSSLGRAGTVKSREFRVGRGLRDPKRLRPQSLSQEISSAHSPGLLPNTTSGRRNSLLFASSPNRQSMPAMQSSLRSPQSLEAELKFVHRVVEERDEQLKDREAYIRQLEDVLRQSHSIPSRQSSAASLLVTPGISPQPWDIPLPASPLTPAFEIAESDLLRPPSTMGISPRSSQGFSITKASPSKQEILDVQDAQYRVNELMKEMKIKEASQREIIEQQFVQIANLQKVTYRLKDELYHLATVVPSVPDGRDQSYESNSSTDQNPQPTTSIINQIREDHAEELQVLDRNHAETIGKFQQEHMANVNELRSALSNREAALDRAQGAHDSLVADLKREHTEAMASMKRDCDLLTEDLETSSTSHEEQRRQLKMKADQASFELSMVRDQHHIQRNNDHRQIAELCKANMAFERIKEELEATNGDLSNKVAELEQRFYRAISPMPPQGPPPSSPLPPLPTETTSPGTPNVSYKTSNSNGSLSRSSSLNISTPDINDAIVGMPEPVAQMIQHILDEHGTAIKEVEALKQQLATGEDLAFEFESKLGDELMRSEGLSKNLQEARKTNSKLRAHLEDARQETRRVSEDCKDHMQELSTRRAGMSSLSEESGRHRDSLVAANAQLEALKGQLDRAVEMKVNKKFGQRLKCF